MMEDTATGVVQHVNRRSLRHNIPMKSFVEDQCDLAYNVNELLSNVTNGVWDINERKSWCIQWWFLPSYPLSSWPQRLPSSQSNLFAFVFSKFLFHCLICFSIFLILFRVKYFSHLLHFFVFLFLVVYFYNISWS